MEKALLNYLICPFNKKKLNLQLFEQDEDLEIKSGILYSESPQNNYYPIINGVPRIFKDSILIFKDKLLEEAEKLNYNDIGWIEEIIRKLPIGNEKNNSIHIQKSFSSEWDKVRDKDYAWGRDIKERKELFLSNLNYEYKNLNGLKILDVGCGHGEVELALIDSGAEIFAVDYSFTVDNIKIRLEKCKNKNKIHLIQSNLLYLPFNDNVFDIVHSDGVLHHNPDTRIAFNSIVRTLKGKNSKCYIMVYSNDHENLFERLLGYYFIRFLKIFTLKMPHWMLHIFCSYLTPVVWFIHKIVNNVTGKKYYHIRTLNEIHLSLFDGLSPKYAHHHSFLEVKEWFMSKNFKEIKKTFYNRNGIGVLGIR